MTLPIYNHEALKGLFSTERDMGYDFVTQVYLEKIPLEEVDHLPYEPVERKRMYAGQYYFEVPRSQMNNLRAALLLDNIHLTRPKDAGGSWWDMERI